MKQLNIYINEGLFDNVGVGVKAQIERWLEDNDVSFYTINDDLTIDVDGSVYLMSYKEQMLPDYIQFNEVNGDFDIHNSQNLVSLKGCPKIIHGYFDCSKCINLKSLAYMPKTFIKHGKADCDIELIGCVSLDNLVGLPKRIPGSLLMTKCNLKSLRGCSEIIDGNIWLSGCSRLKSLKYIAKSINNLCITLDLYDKLIDTIPSTTNIKNKIKKITYNI